MITIIQNYHDAEAVFLNFFNTLLLKNEYSVIIPDFRQLFSSALFLLLSMQTKEHGYTFEQVTVPNSKNGLLKALGLTERIRFFFWLRFDFTQIFSITSLFFGQIQNLNL